jgi:hypothetical protein
MPDSVRIHALRIAAGEDCRAAVADALQRADWALAPKAEVLFLRRIRVGGPLPEIGRLAGEQARQTAARAVDGWDARAEQAEAVRFTEQADLLACLLRDLLHARPRWFWRGWRALFALPPGAAIVRLMDAEALRWPAITHRLDQMGEAETLWQGLSSDDAQQLLYTLQQATGWRLGQTPPALPTARLAANQPLAPAILRDAPVWLRTVASSRTHSGDALLHLALVTWLWRAAPQTLAAADAGNSIAYWADELMASRSSSTLPDATAARPAEKSRQMATKQHGELDENKSAPASPAAMAEKPVPATRRMDTENQPDAPLTVQEHPARGAANQSGRGIVPGAPARNDQSAPKASPPPTTSPAAQPAAISRRQAELLGIELHPPEPAMEAACITRQGGWFLLLNVISLPAVLSHLRSLETAEETAPPTSGWTWLYQLGRACGGEADPPLARFLAHAAGMPDAAALAALPPLAGTEELQRLAGNRFGAALLTAELFAQPALVLVTLSHLDVHFRMTDIRLDVRRAALDINPGWLPWLGRVAAFHYGNPPELTGFDRHEP